MVIQYSSSKEIKFENVVISFNEHRGIVRKKLNRDYEEVNEIIEFGEGVEYLDMRRDIYGGQSSSELYFFLNYDKSDLLVEVEVHQCESIKVLDVSFDFEDELDLVALKLSKYSQVAILSEGEILFKDLKMVLSDKRKMGGEGNSIGYFYCSIDVSHLVSE